MDLSSNIVDSLSKVEELQKIMKKGKISEEEFKVKTGLYLRELDVTGKNLKEVVDLKYAAYLKKKAIKEQEEKDASKADGKDGGKAPKKFNGEKGAK